MVRVVTAYHGRREASA